MRGLRFGSMISFSQRSDKQIHAPKLTAVVRCPLVTRSRLLVVLAISLTTTLLLLVHSLFSCDLLALHQTPCCKDSSAERRFESTRISTLEKSGISYRPIPGAYGKHEYASKENISNSQPVRGSDVTSYVTGDVTRRASRRQTKRRLPQCLIIGVRKGGTRALLEFLNLHPSILAGKQEMHFFDNDRNYALGLEWYRKRMRYSLSDQITVEKTPAYFVDERVPARVHSMNRTIRLLLTVRDPIDRAISDYLQIHSSRIRRGKYHPSFETLAINQTTGEVNRSYKAIRRSIYHRHFERWLRYFRLEQFHLVSSENLVRDPVVELHKVERFLKLDNRLDEGRFLYNRTRGFYCMVSTNGEERCLAPSKGRVHPNIKPDVLRKLQEFFRPHNLIFYQMVGVDFGWQ